MDDYFRCIEGILSTKKYHIFLVTILVLCIGVFFYIFLEEKAYAGKDLTLMASKEISPEVLDPMVKISGLKDRTDEEEKVCSHLEKDKKEKIEKISEEQEKKKEKIKNIVSGYPIEQMIDPMLEMEEETAAFLVSIAKKESDWGRHSPQKNGIHCYNYWGYKGSYNLTSSGYSCFDSPEQAVEIVGGKITELRGRKIDTPERMVVWKCGSSCAGHDPKAVAGWIAQVRNYFYKIVS